MTAYEADLAYIHDAGFGDYARGAAPGLLALLRQSGIADGLVVDLGCGSGIWAAELLRAGYDVFGVDLSAAMLKIARRRAPEATFRRGSLLDVPLPPCAAVTSLGECVCYLFDTKNSKPALARLFARVHAALRPGGVFVFDVAEPGLALGPGPRLSHREGDGWAVLVRAEEDRQTNVLTRHIVSFRRLGQHYRRSEETHRLQLYQGRELAGALRRAGFAVRLPRRFGTFPLLPGRMVVGQVAKPD